MQPVEVYPITMTNVLDARIPPTKMSVSYRDLMYLAIKNCDDVICLVQEEYVGSRLNISKIVLAFNLSDSAVSTIGESRLKNLLASKGGELLIATRSQVLNPRGNGITDMRKIMVEMFGDD